MKQRIMRSVLCESALPSETIRIPKLGNVVIELINRYHIRVWLGPHKNEYKDIDFAIRGKQLEGHADYTLDQRGGFNYDYQESYWRGRGNNVPTPSAEKFMRNEMLQIVRDWSGKHQNSIVTPEQLKAQKRYDELVRDRQHVADNLANIDKEINRLKIVLGIKD